MAKNKKSTFSFGADDGLDFATLNNKIETYPENEFHTEKNNITTSESVKNTETPAVNKNNGNIERINSKNSIEENSSDNREISAVVSKENNDTKEAAKKSISPETIEDSSQDKTIAASSQNKTIAESSQNKAIVESSLNENTIASSQKETVGEKATIINNSISELRNNSGVFYTIDPEKPIKEQNIPYKQDNCKPRVATILDEYMRYVRVRSKKLGIPLNLYINIIIDHYRAGIKNIDDEARFADLYTELSRQYKGSKLRTNFFLIPENAEFIENEITNIGCQPSQYFNHIINLEMQREKEFGPRI